MITTYAISLTAHDCASDVRIKVIDIISDWLVDHFPSAERPAGTHVRTRESSDDPVFRLSIDINPTGSTHSTVLTVTVVNIESSLTFDVRMMSLPNTHRVAPSRATTLPPALIVQLVVAVLRELPVFDANRRVTIASERVSTVDKGQEVAAFIDAPARSLPVLVEIVDHERGGKSYFAGGAGPLAGLAHVFVIESADALKGFIDFSGESLLTPGSIVVFWAGRRDSRLLSLREIPPTSAERERDALVRIIVDTAALSLAAPRIPPPPRVFDDEDEDDGGSVATPSSNADELLAAYEDSQRRIDELESAVAAADAIIAEQRASLEQKGVLVDELVLRNVNLEMSAGSNVGIPAVATMKEALRLARQHCPFLVFHERAITSGETLDGPEPIAVLQDLFRLNEVARAWMSNEINGTTFALACRKVGLDYAPKVSDTSRQKYEEDYAITWRDRTVLAEPHIRRGRKNHLFRIHIYLDDETQQVVVAYIGKHLRGKRDN